MHPINLPFKQRNFKYQINERNTLLLWDIIRKKYVAKTPEEIVRQHIVHMLIEDFQYPKGRIAVEKWLTIDRVRRRFDALVYDENMHPFMLIECKAPSVQLDDEVLFQILHYHKVIPAKFILISNGSYSFLAECRDNQWSWLEVFPSYINCN